MGLLDRVRRAMRPKPAAGTGDDPAAAVDAAYARQLAALQEARRSVVDLISTRKRLEAQADQLRRSSARLDERARAATSAGRDDDARAELAEAVRVERQLPDFDALIADLRTREGSLETSAATLQRNVEAFRIEKEMLKARAAAAVTMEARSSDALAGIGDELDATGELLVRANRVPFE